jgi:putative resolvase
MNETKEGYVSVGKAARFTGLNPQTVRKMADEASIVCYKTPSGQRRISLQSIQELCTSSIPHQKKYKVQKQNFVYARVSTKKQMDDLSRQLEFLKRPEFSNYTVVTDIASGINFKRQGLSTILDSCLQREIGEIVIAHKDRLCRFGYELIEELVTKAGGKITVLDNQDNKTSEQELTDDLLAIIHVFSGRQMEKRSYRSRKVQNIENQNLSNDQTEEAT